MAGVTNLGGNSFESNSGVGKLFCQVPDSKYFQALQATWSLSQVLTLPLQ